MGAELIPELSEVLLEPTNSGTDVASGGSVECCGINDGNVTGNDTGKLDAPGLKLRTLSTSEGEGKRPGNVLLSMDGASANEDGEERDDDKGDEVFESTGGDDIIGIDVG